MPVVHVLFNCGSFIFPTFLEPHPNFACFNTTETEGLVSPIGAGDAASKTTGPLSFPIPARPRPPLDRERTALGASPPSIEKGLRLEPRPPRSRKDCIWSLAPLPSRKDCVLTTGPLSFPIPARPRPPLDRERTASGASPPFRRARTAFGASLIGFPASRRRRQTQRLRACRLPWTRTAPHRWPAGWRRELPSIGACSIRDSTLLPRRSGHCTRSTCLATSEWHFARPPPRFFVSNHTRPLCTAHLTLLSHLCLLFALIFINSHSHSPAAAAAAAPPPPPPPPPLLQHRPHVADNDPGIIWTAGHHVPSEHIQHRRRCF
ncbi:hypothetical protein RJ55_02920 [Drechmeria coniospora]|nr:hypothetical protein RJ55_02920 [Drechmeria coniospora]